MSAISTALSLVAALNPTTAEIATTLGSLNKIPSTVRDTLLQNLSEDMLKKIATWGQTFVTEVNQLDGVTHKTLAKLVNPSISDDFLTTMAASGLDEPLLQPSDLDDLGNSMTTAIKAQNWIQAIQVGFALARLLPAA